MELLTVDPKNAFIMWVIPDFLKPVMLGLTLPTKRARKPPELPTNHKKRLGDATVAQNFNLLFDLMLYLIIFNTKELLIFKKEEDEDWTYL